MRLTLLASLPLLALGCGDKDDSGGLDCAAMYTEPEALDGTLGPSDICGHWSLAVGEHAYINVEVGVDTATCEADLSSNLTLPYDPIFSNPSNEPAKWTFDVEATEAGMGSVNVTCSDGSWWLGDFTVE